MTKKIKLASGERQGGGTLSCFTQPIQMRYKLGEFNGVVSMLRRYHVIAAVLAK